MRAASGYHWSQQTNTPSFAQRGLNWLETKVSRRKIKLFVVGRIVRNVHFTIFSCYGTIFFKNDSCIVIQARCGAFRTASIPAQCPVPEQAFRKKRWKGPVCSLPDQKLKHLLSDKNRGIVKLLQYDPVLRLVYGKSGFDFPGGFLFASVSWPIAACTSPTLIVLFMDCCFYKGIK